MSGVKSVWNLGSFLPIRSAGLGAADYIISHEPGHQLAKHSFMSDDEDDYLSDKFLLEAASGGSSAPKTYSQRRKDASRLSAIKNEQHRKKSRRQLEADALEEGLSKSLFERAKEEEEGGQQKNKALAMMMKMGFKPGQSLGRTEDDHAHDSGPSASAVASSDSRSPPRISVPPDSTLSLLSSAASPSVSVSPFASTVSRGLEGGGGVDEREGNPADDNGSDSVPNEGASTSMPVPVSAHRHRTVPLPINEWAGKKGIGLGKRAASPGASERLAKMAKMAEQHEQTSFRDRARLEYEERRAEGRLAPAQRTCNTLDEKAGKEFNVLWLNPHNPDTFPEGLIDALEDPLVLTTIRHSRADNTSIEGRLRAKMQIDALRPLKASLEEDELAQDKATLSKTPYSEEEIEEATQFLRLSAKDRLELVLGYLRQKHCYCFWCGTQYTDEEDMGTHCPGPDEDAHD